MKFDVDILEKFATPKQAKYLRAWKQAGGVTAAARLLGVNESTVRRGIEAVETKARRHRPSSDYAEHLLIPDTQVRPQVCLNHLNALGNYIIDKQPDHIVQIGDWADMHSLSTYDRGTYKGEGARYKADIESAIHAMEVLMEPIRAYNSRNRAGYKPKLDLTLGNHENRINRIINSDPSMIGFMSTDDLQLADFGWTVHDFLDPVEIDGVLYAHFFPRNASGRIVQTTRGAPSARVQVQREGQSCSSGHLQGLDFHVQQRATRREYGVMAGSFYMHEEDYLSAQGTAYWRGVVYKHEVMNGEYDPMFVSMRYLLDNYWDGVDRYACT